MALPGAPAPPSAHLDAFSISFAYRSRQGTPFELVNITASMARGSITGLLGPNGSGKSTLLRILAGIATPDAGHVRLNGRSLAALTRRDIARRIALVPQGTHPAFDYSSVEMVLMGRHPHLGPFELEGPDDLDVAHSAMRETGTLELADRSFLTLSGGEQQRVVLASALAQSSDVLLLDEPTASLDLGYQLDIGALLVRLNRDRQMTMVIATHDLNFAARVCDHLVLLRSGRLLGAGPTSSTLTADTVRALYDVDAHVGVSQLTGQIHVEPRHRIG